MEEGTEITGTVCLYFSLSYWVTSAHENIQYVKVR